MNYRLIVKDCTRAPVVEVDTEAQAVYVRFTRAKVARTIDRGGRNALVTVDLDGRGDVVGIEMVGMAQFTLSFILRLARVDAPEEVTNRVRYVPAQMSSRGVALVPA